MVPVNVMVWYGTGGTIPYYGDDLICLRYFGLLKAIIGLPDKKRRLLAQSANASTTNEECCGMVVESRKIAADDSLTFGL